MAHSVVLWQRILPLTVPGRTGGILSRRTLNESLPALSLLPSPTSRFVVAVKQLPLQLINVLG